MQGTGLLSRPALSICVQICAAPGGAALKAVGCNFGYIFQANVTSAPVRPDPGMEGSLVDSGARVQQKRLKYALFCP